MDKRGRLLDQNISDEKRNQYLEQNWKLEGKLSSLLDEELYMLEDSLLGVFGHKSWFSHADEFLDYTRSHEISLVEALDGATILPGTLE